MYDFESVSVSAFEAASLAATLTEKSADGWEVVAIVPAGSDVVAYLRRSAQGEEVEAGVETSPADTSTAEPAGTAADLLTPTSVSREPSVAGGARDEDTSAPAASDTGGTGWGAGADTSTPATTASSWSQHEAAAESASTSSWGGSAQQQAPTPTPSVPAGWYADPAGRYELRYWDGTAWTEHVSRGGQQFTDPPVA